MTSKTDDVVTGFPFTVTVPIPGTDRSYTLRAPTFGEVGAMAARQAGAPIPSDAVFVEALREAIAAMPMDDCERSAHMEAIQAAEDAGEMLDSLYAVHGMDRRAWDAEARREIAEADRIFRAARKGRDRAEWVARDAPALATLRRHQMDAGRREQVEMLMLCMTGDGAPRTPADVDALPAGDVLILYQRAMGLMRPSAAAEKN